MTDANEKGNKINPILASFESLEIEFRGQKARPS